MNYWHQIPLFRLIIPFIIGIILAISFDSEIHIPLLLFIILSLFIAVFVFFSKKISNYKTRWLFGVIVYVLIFFLGFELTIIHTEKFHQSHFKNLYNKGNLIIATVSEPIEEKENSNKTIIRVQFVKTDSTWKRATGKVIVYFEKDSLSSHI
ncbi:MAG: DUF4131 domain-containing protein, partial [Bacteroidales bacterium]|nr:DUF4131 domain-containing protein [Bacteroidales bacterium]